MEVTASTRKLCERGDRERGYTRLDPNSSGININGINTTTRPFRIPQLSAHNIFIHDDVIEWKHFPRYWPFVREIHQSPVNSPQKGQLHRPLILSWGW